MKIVLDGAPVLRRKAADARIEDIKKGLYRGLIKEMHQILAGCRDGVALAAPQVGESVRLFIVSPKVFEDDTEKKDANTENKKIQNKAHLVYFNPILTKLSKESKDMDEGCLSVNGLYGKVPRNKKALISAYDESGNKFTRGASGLLAQIFQHEVDHLNGILFTDKASVLHTLESRKTNV